MAKKRPVPFTNDVIFGMAMKDPKIAKDVIERCLGIKVGRIEVLETQHEDRQTPEGKGVRYDVYVEDGSGTCYDVEMQVGKEDRLGRRMRAYQSIVDGLLARKGDEYPSIKESYIVFICTKDPFDLGIPRYTIERACAEAPSVDVGCGAHWVALNASAHADVPDAGLRHLLRYVSTGSVAEGDDGIEAISEKVAWLNEGEGVIAMLADQSQKMRQERQKGIEIGRAEGMAEGEALAYGLVGAVSKELTRLGRSDEIPAVLAKGREGVEKLAEELGLAQPTR